MDITLAQLPETLDQIEARLKARRTQLEQDTTKARLFLARLQGIVAAEAEAKEPP